MVKIEVLGSGCANCQKLEKNAREAVGMAGVFGLLSGVWPAWKMSRQHPVNALKGGAS